MRRTSRALQGLGPALAAIALAGCAHLGPTDAPAPIVRGPIPGRTQEPIKLTYLALRPRRATIQAAKTTSISVQEAYSNIFLDDAGSGDRVLLDGEISRTSIALRRALTERTDIEVEVAVLFATAGFLDGIIESYHKAFGFPDEDRDERPRNAYAMEVEKDGVVAYSLEPDEPGFGDLPIVVTHALLVESATSPAVALRVGVELPTGSESKGFGNGGLDFGSGILAEKSFGRWTATGAVDYVLPHSSDAFEAADVAAQDGFDLQFGLEYRWNDRLSLLLGAILEPPVTRDIGLSAIDDEILSIDVGCVFDLGERSRLLLGFEEDAIANSGPDLTLLVGWSLLL